MGIGHRRGRRGRAIGNRAAGSGERGLRARGGSGWRIILYGSRLARRNGATRDCLIEMDSDGPRALWAGGAVAGHYKEQIEKAQFLPSIRFQTE